MTPSLFVTLSGGRKILKVKKLKLSKLATFAFFDN
jgi:hypothetical protein